VNDRVKINELFFRDAPYVFIQANGKLVSAIIVEPTISIKSGIQPYDIMATLSQYPR
jgi:hypothetical protein